MTFEVVPFSPAHIRDMDLPERYRLTEEQKHALGGPVGDSWTAMGNGRPVACGGLMEVWEGRGYAWTLMGRDSGPWMVHITRAVKRGLSLAEFKRIEMAVDASFKTGCRWAEMLGFVRETPWPLKAYLPGGRDAWLYARISNG